jgi:hypothetical protein
MDQEEYQLEFFLKTIKKCLSNLCNKCIDEVCDSAVRKVLLTKVEPGKKIETYLRILKEKRSKIECSYKSVNEEISDIGIEDFYVSDNNSNLTDEENINQNTNNKIKQINVIERINKIEIFPAKKNKGNKKKKKRNCV